MIFKSLFKGRDRAASTGAKSAKEGDAVTYKSYVITPAPQAEGGQFRVAGRITVASEPDGAGEANPPAGSDSKQHEFVRADLSTSWDDACALTVSKAKRIIDERGDNLFS